MMKLFAVVVIVSMILGCAARTADVDPSPDPPAEQTLERMIKGGPPPAPPAQWGVNAPFAQPRLTQPAGVAEVDPIARRGSKIAWTPGIVDGSNSAPTRFETSFDGAVYTPVGMATTVDIPDMSSGTHVFRVRACNSEGCSDRDNPAGVGVLAFNYVNAVPAPPTGIQVIPPSTTPIASAQEGSEMVSCHWFLSTRGQKLNGRQLNAIVAQYDGVVPPTWGSAEIFMDRIVWSGFTP